MIHAFRLGLLVFLFVAPQMAQAQDDESPTFQLTSSETFTTRDQPAFGLGYRRLAQLDFRVYRVRDPLAFFTTEPTEAVSVTLSPSTSDQVPLLLAVWPSLTVTLAWLAATTGASFTGLTVIVTVVTADSPPRLSLARYVNVSSPK